MNWKQTILERDGTTPCFVRIMTIAGTLAYAAITGLAIYRGQPIGYVEWAAGYTAIVAGGAGAARLKLETEGAEQGEAK